MKKEYVTFPLKWSWSKIVEDFLSYDRSTIGKLDYLVQFPLSDISTVSSDQLKGSVTLTTTDWRFG